MEYCSNPLHKQHRVPFVPDDQPDMDFLYRATKYPHQAYEAYDTFFKLSPVTVMPLDWFKAQMESPNGIVIGDENESKLGARDSSLRQKVTYTSKGEQARTTSTQRQRTLPISPQQDGCSA